MKSVALKLQRNNWRRIAFVTFGGLVLGLVYIFQRINVAGLFGDLSPNLTFIINRTTRLVINDLACFLIILGLFRKKGYLKIAFWVFLVELLVILPIYLIIKLNVEGNSEISSPLLSHIHRLIVNPMLMILLIAGFFYQKFLNR